jgi:nicotinic acid mononucleotide adenylyltransferase
VVQLRGIASRAQDLCVSENARRATRQMKQPKPEVVQHPNLVLVNAPVVEISSSYIRKAHKAGKNVRPLLPPAVWKYMDEMNFYR